MLNIIYAGTPEFAVPPLQALVGSRHQVAAVYTQPDRPAGRGRKLQPSPIKQLAMENAIPVEQPPSLRDPDARERLAAYQPDLMVVAAYGLILPRQVLEIPRLGCVNIHASLLPRWRGAAPIQRAILAGDEVTGITLMQMDQGLDTGAMLASQQVPIGPSTTAAELHDSLKQVGADLLMSHLDAIEQGKLSPQVQDDQLATYADKLVKQEARIDWSKSATELAREVRAYDPWPVSHCALDDQNVKVWRAEAAQGNSDHPPGQVVQHDRQALEVACGDGVLRISELQFAGKKRQTSDQLLNARNLAGRTFA
jgi:methionyl-tRNA formyltransferase